jgi:hypothetical protein
MSWFSIGRCQDNNVATELGFASATIKKKKQKKKKKYEKKG